MKVPPLRCPQCKSTLVFKDHSGAIICDECNKATNVHGKVEHKSNANRVICNTKKRNYPEGFFE